MAIPEACGHSPRIENRADNSLASAKFEEGRGEAARDILDKPLYPALAPFRGESFCVEESKGPIDG